MFAAVKFICDSTFRIVHTDEIKDFVNSDSVYNVPFAVRKLNNITGVEEYEPAFILNLSNDYLELENNQKRYKYPKMRRSDALEIIAKRSAVEKQTESTTDEIKEKAKASTTNKDLKKKKKDVEKKVKELEHAIDQDILNSKFGFDLQLDPDNVSDIETFKKEIDKQNSIIKELQTKVNDFNKIKNELEEKRVKILELENDLNIANRKLEKKKVVLKKKNEKISKLRETLQEIQQEFDVEGASAKKAGGVTKEIHEIDDIQDKINDKINDNIEVMSPHPINENFNGCVNHNDEITQCSTPKSLHNDLRSIPSRNNWRNLLDSDDEHHSSENNDVEQLRPKKRPRDASTDNVTNNASPRTNQLIMPKTVDNVHDTDGMEDGKEPNENSLPEFHSWTDNVNGKKIKRYHLSEGLSILRSEWKIAESKTTNSLYVRFMAESLWGNHALMNQALDVRKVTTKLQGRSPVKECTPKRLRVLEKCYHRYLRKAGKDFENLTEKQRKLVLNEWRCFLKCKINALRGGKCERNDSTENTSKEEV